MGPFLKKQKIDNIYLSQENSYMKRITLISLCVFIIFSPFICVAKTLSKTKNSNINRVLLVVAMESEALPIINTFHLHPSSIQHSPLPMKSFEGQHGNIKIALIQNGRDPKFNVQNVGTQPATLATYIGIQNFHPDLIISIGTAGGIGNKGAQIGDIFISNKIYFIDRRIQQKNYDLYGIGEYETNTIDSLLSKTNIKRGNICTGNSFDENKTDYSMSLKYQCVAIEMEAAAVAWVSMLTNTPMIAVKGITDIAQSKTAFQDYEKNVDMISNQLSITLKKILNRLNTSV